MSAQFLPHDWFPKPLPPNVIIGADSWIYSSFAFVHYRSEKQPGVRIGHDSGIYYTSFFELGPHGQVEIGDYCTLVGGIVNSDHRVVIGNYAFVAHEVLIADSAFAIPVGNRLDRGEPEESGIAEIVIGENAWIGARAILLSGANIGEGAIVGAAAMVDFQVPPYTIVAGNPARVVGRVKRGSRPKVIA